MMQLHFSSLYMCKIIFFLRLIRLWHFTDDRSILVVTNNESVTFIVTVSCVYLQGFLFIGLHLLYFFSPFCVETTLGTFGQVLECWDIEKREAVAIKIVRSIRKYREAAMIEIDVLQSLLKHDLGGTRQALAFYLFSHFCL